MASTTLAVRLAPPPAFREGARSQRFMEEFGAGRIPSAGELQTSLGGKRFGSPGLKCRGAGGLPGSGGVGVGAAP